MEKGEKSMKKDKVKKKAHYIKKTKRTETEEEWRKE